MRGLYLHIPFCLSKCEYCDFNSYAGKLGLANEYISALLSEAAAYKGSAADTVYIGGGTPTALPREELCRLVTGLKEIFFLPEGREFTVEMNPRTANTQYLEELRRLGVNRISLGAQSFNGELLKTLGRLHGEEDIKAAVEMCREAGFENVSLDLMFSLPGQSMETWKETLEKAVNCGVEHISCYGLKIEEGTPFYQKGVQPLEDLLDREMYHYAIDFLEKNGYMQYEISNFAKPGFKSLHNLKYWHCQEYYGLGAGAHGYISGVRTSNVKPVEEYIRQVAETGGAREEAVTLTKADMRVERIIMGMRLTEGIPAEYIKQPERYIKGGYMEKIGNNIRFTVAGFDVSNAILAELI